VDNPEQTCEGNFATLVISQENLDPDSGLIVIEANDLSKVERFCKNPPSLSPSIFEDKEMARCQAIGAKLRTLVEDFQYWRGSGEERSFLDDFEPSPFDSPGDMI
jgi:hypothetical protein